MNATLFDEAEKGPKGIGSSTDDHTRKVRRSLGQGLSDFEIKRLVCPETDKCLLNFLGYEKGRVLNQDVQ